MEQPIPTAPPNAANLRANAAALAERARSLTITSDVELQAASAMLVEVKGVVKDIRDAWDPLCAQADRLHKTLTGSRGAELKDPVALEDALKAMIGKYVTDQQEKRAADERAAQAALKAQMEDAALDQAEALQQAGMPEMAEAVLDAPIEPPVVTIAPPPTPGVSVAKRWTFEIIDPKKINPDYLMPNTVAIRAQVNALKGDARKLIGEGVRIFQAPNTNVRTPRR